MGRYLDALALMQKEEPKKPNQPETGGCLGFLGTPPPTFKKIEGLTEAERNDVIVWLHSIGEHDQIVVDEVLHRCDVDLEGRDYYLRRALVVPPSIDDRRWCAECSHYDRDGYCHGEPEGTLGRYRPWQGLPRRCESFNKPRDTLIDKG